ncbi:MULTISPECIES: transposase [unclassified Streptomyces]|uniref:transposase n=1 Tax=unclassified Streptomyces TaxID=2593676 RepID=UPI003851431C
MVGQYVAMNCRTPSGSPSGRCCPRRRERKRLDDRTVLNGIAWKFRTGVAWRDAPERYGPWPTLHTRFRDPRA